MPASQCNLRGLAPFLFLVGLALPALSQPEPVIEASERIDASRIESTIREIASDVYEGRGPASAGDRMTRDFLIERLQSLGYEAGAADGAWEQPFPIVGIESHMPASWSFRREEHEISFEWWNQYIAGSGMQSERGHVEDAQVVFVGYGITAPEEDWDDFKGADLRGKILVMLNDDPNWDPNLFAGNKRLYYGRWTYKYESAARQGAAGAIIIHTTESAGYPFQVVQTSWTGEQFELPAGDEPRVQLAAWLAESAARELFAFAGVDYDDALASARSREFQPIDLGIRTALDWTATLSSKETANVLGLLRGSDPELADELVVYTAHHDHLGIGEPDANGDRIYNGAVDNASGVAQVLAIAEAFASLAERPRRSILILPVAAEEQGLLGSGWYCANPTVAPGLIAANINIDGGNIFGRTEDVAVIGRGKSDLEDGLEQFARLQGRRVVDEPSPDKGYYYRSDQINFAKIGVPALYFKSGQSYRDRPAGWGAEQDDLWRATRYHQPSDELTGDWNFAGMVEDARLAFLVGWAVAQADAPAAWRAGDEFEGLRRQALEQLDR